MKEAESQNILAYGDLTKKNQQLPGSGYMPLSQNDGQSSAPTGASSAATTRARNVPGQNNINTLNHGATPTSGSMPPNPFGSFPSMGGPSEA